MTIKLYGLLLKTIALIQRLKINTQSLGTADSYEMLIVIAQTN